MAVDGPGSTQVQRGRHDSPFFRSKFRVPTTPQHFVRRPRLVELLDDLAEYPVTALVAPAGAGKTALAADWVRLSGRRAVWLALDEPDRRAPQLLTALAAAVDQFAPGCAQASSSVLRRPGEPEEAVHVLVEALEDVDPGQAVLVIDDVHLVDEDPVAAACLSSFIEHKPSWLFLLLLSRRQLAVPVDRLRASGALADLTFDALRFTEVEAIEMLTALCPDVAPEALPEVTEWADGWAAALQLAALAVRSQRTPGAGQSTVGLDPPAGSGRLVDEYLWHEVLRAERPEMVELLLDVAVVDRVNYPLAEALTERADAGDLLSEAEQRGLFVTSLEAGGWFEVHGLVRDMLRGELERRWSGRLRAQHARAARWFETADDRTTALGHWLAAGMPREALRLLADLAVELFEGGRQLELRTMIDEISGTLSDAEVDAEALVELAWCWLLVDRESFGPALAAAESAAPAGGAGSVRPTVLRSAAALVNGDWRRSECLARAATEVADRSSWLDSIGRYAWTLVAHGIALDERWLEGSQEVGEVRHGVRNNAARLLALDGTRAVGLALAGHPLDAIRTTAGVRQVAEAGETTTLRAELDLADAVALRELGDDQAAAELLELLSTQASYPTAFVQVLAQLEVVDLRLSAGELDHAEAAFRTAAATCEREGPAVTSCLARRGVRLSLALRDHDAAERWSQRIEDPFWQPISEARLSLAKRQSAEALGALALAAPRCARHRVVQHLVLARALRDGERGSAEKEVATAVEIAAEHGMLETVGSEGLELLDLLELAAWRVPEGWMRRLRHAVVGGEALVPSPGALVDDLTARERDVLRLLPTRLTVREIAGELFVSHNTLKFHLRVIYQKLGVNSRAEAVDTARRLGLLRTS